MITKKVSLRRILDDTRLHRLLLARSVRAIQAVEGRDMPLEHYLQVVDSLKKEKR